MSNSTDLYTNSLQVTTIQSNGGLSVPLGSTAQRPTGLLRNGTIRFNSSIGKMETYINSEWVSVIDQDSGDDRYVTQVDGYVTTNLDIRDNKIINLNPPENPKDAVNLAYLLQKLADLEGNVDAGTLKGHPLSDFVLITRKVLAGTGMTGGGELANDVTLTLGTPSVITSTSTNNVTDETHSHALTLTSQDIIDYLGYTPADRDLVPSPEEAVYNTRQVLAGSGLVGGGNLAQDVTIHLGTPSDITFSTDNTSTVGTHSHKMVLTKQNIETIMGGDIVPVSRTISAGVGLEGGGDLTNNRQIAMKTPQSVSIHTPNAATGDGHTHNVSLSKADIESITGPLSIVNTSTNIQDMPIGSIYAGGLDDFYAVAYGTQMWIIPGGELRRVHYQNEAHLYLPGVWVTRGLTGIRSVGESPSTRTVYSYIVQKIAN